MRYNKFSCLLFTFICFVISSCNAQKANRINEPISLKKLIELAPAVIFDETTEGISMKEKKELLANQTSANWLLCNKTTSYIVAKAKVPFSSVSMFQVSTEKKEPILVILTENEKTQSIKTMLYKNSQFESLDIIPKIQTAEFFKGSEKQNIARKYPYAINYTFDKSNKSFDVSISNWMNEELAALNPDYRLRLVWKETKFIKRKVKIKSN